MFKSVFAKYVTMFMVLLLVAFLLFMLIVDSVLTNYTEEAKTRHIGQIADACSENLVDIYKQSGAADFGAYLRGEISADTDEAGFIRRIMQAVMANSDNMTVFVTDERGGIIFCTGIGEEKAPADGEPLLSDETLTRLEALSEEILNADGNETTENGEEPVREGLYLKEGFPAQKDQNIGFASPIYTTDAADRPVEVVGYVLIVTDSSLWNEFMDTTLRSVAVAGAWIMLAALIAIYFTTERVISPLREMSRAAKKLMVGKFDVRIRVRGRDEVAELAAAFNQMAQSLENLEHMRNAFVANVSHDLRTPMTTIAGFIDGIIDGVIPPEEQDHYLRVVSDEVRRLSRLVTELLDVSRLQAGDRKFDFQPFDVCKMGRQILISFEQKIDDKHMDVDFDCEEDHMFVMADHDAIYQILYNICDNAVKFSTEGGKLKVSFTYMNGDGFRNRKVLVKVYNEGPGIPPEDLPFIFERFYKSDKSRSLDKTGVGLGMFITKTIIDAHHESIWVNSEYGKNCEFSFTLARTDPPAPKNAAKPAGAIRAAKTDKSHEH